MKARLTVSSVSGAGAGAGEAGPELDSSGSLSEPRERAGAGAGRGLATTRGMWWWAEMAVSLLLLTRELEAAAPDLARARTSLGSPDTVQLRDLRCCSVLSRAAPLPGRAAGQHTEGRQ